MIKFSKYNFKDCKNYINLRNSNLIFLGNKNFIKSKFRFIKKSILCTNKNFLIHCKCKSCKFNKIYHPDLFELNYKNFLNNDKIINENLLKFKHFYSNKSVISKKKLLIIMYPEFYINVFKIINNILENHINENLKIIIVTNKFYIIPNFLKFKLIKVYFYKNLSLLSLFKKNFYINYIKNNIKYLNYIFKYYKNYNILSNKKFFIKNHFKIYIYFIKLIKFKIKFCFIKKFFIQFKLLISLIKKFIYDNLKINCNNKTKYFNYKFYKKKININKIYKLYNIIISYFNINNKNYKYILFEKLMFNFNILNKNE